MLNIFKIFFLILLLSSQTIATPREVILVRHADKLMQLNSDDTLSAKGQVRAINLAIYYVERYEPPDYIFGTDPKNYKSIRQLQTVSPLANLLTEKYPNRKFQIFYPYESSEYKKLVDDLLNNAKYDNKSILICWSHSYLPELAKELGVKTEIPKWPSNDYDSVYIIKFHYNKLISFNILHEQYPVNFNPSWEDLHHKLNK